MIRRFCAVVPGLLLALGTGVSAKANLLTNGSFETGDLTGWTDGGNVGWHSVSGAAAAPGEGAYGIFNGASGSFSLLSQTVPTVPGNQYQIDFWELNDGAGQFHVLFDGVSVFDDVGTSHAYTHYIVFGTASAASTVLLIQSRDDPGYFQFDAFEVNGAVLETPEAGSVAIWAIVGAGAGAGYLVRERRRRAVAA